MQNRRDQRHLKQVAGKASRRLSPLAVQLIRYIAGIYTLFILTVTAAQLYAEYVHERDTLIKELARLESTFNPPLSDALWDLDVESVLGTMLGMQQLDSVLGVRVDTLTSPEPIPAGFIMDSGQLDLNNYKTKTAFRYYHGIVSDDDGRISRYQKNKPGSGEGSAKIFESLDSVHFPVLHTVDGERYLVGIAHIYTGPEVIISRISYGFILIILASVAKTVLLWLLFYCFMNHLVTKPLSSLTREAIRLNPEYSGNPKHAPSELSPELLKRTDELGTLATGMAAMARALVEKNQKIRHYNQTLEQKVQERTQELGVKSRDLKAMMDNIRQGILTITQNGAIHKEYSESVKTIFNTRAPHQETARELIFARLNVEENLRRLYNESLKNLFHSEITEAPGLLSRLPSESEYHSGDGVKILHMDWKMIRDQKHGLDKVLLVVEDVSKVRKIQAELTEAKKVASLSHLVAGVAHELNTPAGIILTSASTCLHRAEAIQENTKQGILKRSELDDFILSTGNHCRVILDSARKASNLVSSFRQLAWSNNLDTLASFDIAEHCDSILEKLSGLFPGYSYTAHINQRSPVMITSYPSAIEQVITRLVSNAIIHGKNQEHISKVEISIKNEENNVILSISDQGPGINKESLDKIYDPFFTTSLGQGESGLGLAIVYNIVTFSLNGKISCNTMKGKGTCFTIRLPIHLAPAL